MSDKTTKLKAKRQRGGSYEKPTPEKIAFGKRLKTAREISGLDLTEAANTMGYSQPVQLSLMETGKRMPPFSVVIALARLYGTTTDYLCGLEEDVERDPAVGMQRAMTSRISGDLQRLIQQLSNLSVGVVRHLMPSASDGQRLAMVAFEVHKAVETLRTANPKADEKIRGLATLLAKSDALHAQATAYAAQADRARRVLRARIGDTTGANKGGDPTGPEQMSLVPILEMLCT